MGVDVGVQDLGTENSFVSFQAIKEKVWDIETYQNTEVIEGVNPINVSDDFIKVVSVDPTDLGRVLGVQRGFRERYPDLAKLEKDYESVVQVTSTNSEIIGRLKIK